MRQTSTAFVAHRPAAAADRTGVDRAPLVLTDGIVASPAPAASVDLGGATATLPAPLTEPVDADRTGPGRAAPPDHPVDVCATQAALPSVRDVARSESGGNQSGGATEGLSPPGPARSGTSARRGVG